MTYRLYSGTVGRDGDVCDECDKRIRPHDKMVIRNDGALFCDRKCALDSEQRDAVRPKAVRVAAL